MTASPWMLYALSGVATLVLAGARLFSHERMLGKIIAANLMGSGIFLLFVAIARRSPEGIPDPVIHALVLTSIVVSVSATALALGLMRRVVEQGRGDGESNAWERRCGE